MEKERLVRKFDRQAVRYDRSREQRALGAWRADLLRDARGHVFEAAVGAGANFPFYRNTEVTLTAVDFSPAMVQTATQAARRYGIEANIYQHDLETLDFPDQSFDTIVSTLSLCGYEDPVAVLRKFNRWCKIEGQILLLEHGTSSFYGLKLLQHAINPLFRSMSGCNLNRDTLSLIAQSPLVIASSERHFYGIMHLIRAKPGPG